MRSRNVAIAIAGMALLLAACGGGTPSALPSSAAPPVAGPATKLGIVAKDIAFDPTAFGAPAGSPLEVTFENRDAGIPHNVALYGGPDFGMEIQKGDIITGIATTEFTIPGVVAGTYQFRCDVHPNMTAELTVGG